jgi:hypothetical protein
MYVCVHSRVCCTPHVKGRNHTWALHLSAYVYICLSLQVYRLIRARARTHTHTHQMHIHHFLPSLDKFKQAPHVSLTQSLLHLSNSKQVSPRKRAALIPRSLRNQLLERRTPFRGRLVSWSVGTVVWAVHQHARQPGLPVSASRHVQHTCFVYAGTECYLRVCAHVRIPTYIMYAYIPSLQGRKK